MYRYMPPKSSVWGHKLRGMSPAREKELFDEFLRRAAAQYSFTSGSLMIARRDRTDEHSTAEVVQRFERLLGLTARVNYFACLSAAQFDRCFATVEGDPTLLSAGKVHVLLGARYDVSQWRIEGAEVPTDSQFRLNFGTLPGVSTFLTFETVEQFHHIQRVLADLRFCRLNEKHLKPVKVGRR